MKPIAGNYLTCPICEYDYVEFITTISFDTTDHYSTVKINIEGTDDLLLDMKYDYRSSGNIHLVFRGEGCGHWFIKSFDGHKGMIYMDENTIMNSLQDYLNKQQDKSEDLLTYDDFKKECRDFFIDRARQERASKV